MLGLIERTTAPFAVKAASPAPGALFQQVLSVTGGPQQIPRPQRYEDFAKAYGTVVWVYAAVARKARDSAAVPLTLAQRTDVGVTTVSLSHPLRQLLDKVNPFMTRADLFEGTSANLDLVGNAYWLVFDDARGRPAELWPLRPDRVEVIPSATDYVGGYRYLIGKDEYRFAASQVIHFREFNPWHDYYGQGALTAAWDSAVIMSDAHAWNRSLLQNAGRLDGILSSDQPVTEGQAKESAARFREQFAGPRNAGRVMILGRGLKYTTIATTPKDLDFVNSLHLTREEILAAIGVRPVILGLEAGDIGRRSEQIRDYFYSTVGQRIGRIIGTVNEFLTPRYGDAALEVVPDIETALLPYEDRVALAQADTLYVQNRILLPNEVRQRRGLGPIEGGDVVLVPISMVPIDQAGQLGAGGTFGGGGAAGAAPGTLRAPHALPKAAKDARDELWGEFVDKASRLEVRFEAGVRRAFVATKEQLVSALSEGVTPQSALTHALATGRALLVGLAQAVLPAVLESGWTRAARLIAVGLDRAKAPQIGISFDLAIPELAAYITGRPLVYADLITQSLAVDFRDLFTAQANAGASVPQMAAAVAERFDVLTVARATVIARTEVIAASNLAAFVAYEQSGVVEEQEWLSARDERVRDSHRVADGQTVGLADAFRVGGSLLRYPGDPAGPPEEVINCRCTTLPVLTQA
jgi:HK97 family phage portal protein